MNPRYILVLTALIMLSVLAACTSISSSAPTGAITIPSSTSAATNTLRPTVTPNPTATPIVYPMRLEYVGGFGGIADALALHEHRVYLKVGSRVVTIDVSDPYHPTEMGHSDVSIEDIDLIDTSADGHILVQDKEDTLWEFEALPDGNLTLLHSYTRNDAGRPKMNTTDMLVAVGGGYRFEYDPDWLEYPGAQPLSIHDERDEVIGAIGSLPAGVIAVSKIIAARGRFVYIAVGYGLAIYDIGVNPDRPYAWGPMDGVRKTEWREVATLKTTSKSYFQSMGGGRPSIQVFDGYLSTDSGTWSLENPENPIRPLKTENIVFPCNGFSVKGGIIYSYIDNNGLYTFLDMRNPEHYIRHRIAAGIENARVLESGNELLFVGSGYEYGNEKYTLHILDASDPFNPRLLSSYPVQGYLYFDEYNLIGNYLYINPVSSMTPAVILDLTDPARPEPVDISGNPFLTWYQPIVYDNWIINVQSGHLLTYDSSDVFTPVSDIAIPGAEVFFGQPSNSICFNDKLYIYGDNTVFVVNIDDPAHPHLFAKVRLPSDWSVAEVASYGDYLYFVDMYGEVHIYKLVAN